MMMGESSATPTHPSTPPPEPPAPAPNAFGTATIVAPAGRTWGRFLQRMWRHRPAAIGAIIVAVFVAAAVPGFFIWLDADAQPYFERRLSPSWDHPLGTDKVGRDMLSVMFFGAWTSLRVGILAVGLSMLIGVPLGIVSGYFGGWIDLILGRAIDTLMVFPSILLAMVIVAISKPSLENVTLAVGLVGSPIFARQVRATVLVIRSVDFVTAARAVGFSNFRILWRVILPNCLTPILVLGTLAVGGSMLEFAGLSFLGLTGDPAIPEWGRLLDDYKSELTTGHPWLVLAPGIAIFLSVLGFNLLGDGLRDLLDPRLARAAKPGKSARP